MKILIGDSSSYTFDASERQITIPKYDLQLFNFLIITNITDNLIIYNFAKPGLGGSFSDGVLTLDYDTTSMDDNDELQIIIDIESNSESQLNQIQNAIAAIRSTIGIAADLRVTLLSGTVTTVSSVTNVAAIGGLAGLVPMNALMNLAYIQSNSNNIA